jgi:hypothetical protein
MMPGGHGMTDRLSFNLTLGFGTVHGVGTSFFNVAFAIGDETGLIIIGYQV